MMKIAAIILLLSVTGILWINGNDKNEHVKESVYDFKAVNLDGQETSMEAYRGKTLLIVNTASRCGFTPQFEGLERLYQKYRDQGLVIIGFPCNQFGGQEPGDEASISQTCHAGYGVTFPMMQKTEVNGSGAHPLFVYLKKELPGFPGRKIKWNFTKFLIDAQGRPVKRFAPWTKPEKIDRYLERQLYRK